ncbi:MAG: ribonuclease HII [Nanoarchaeota archaeon]
MAIIGGVEEAGRGPVIGPMVMAICAMEEKDIGTLKALGVKDSKLLTPQQREGLFEHIKRLTKHTITIISAKEIDAALESEDLNLNWLEAQTSATLIDGLDAKLTKVILDCPSNNIPAYTAYVKKHVKRDVEIIAEHKADLNHTIVGAASILAKVTRDREIETIKKKIGHDFGSGYPSDPSTIAFLEKYHDAYDIFRTSWASYRNAGQKTLHLQLVYL